MRKTRQSKRLKKEKSMWTTNTRISVPNNMENPTFYVVERDVFCGGELQGTLKQIYDIEKDDMLVLPLSIIDFGEGIFGGNKEYMDSIYKSFETLKDENDFESIDDMVFNIDTIQNWIDVLEGEEQAKQEFCDVIKQWMKEDYLYTKAHHLDKLKKEENPND